MPYASTVFISHSWEVPFLSSPLSCIDARADFYNYNAKRSSYTEPVANFSKGTEPNELHCEEFANMPLYNLTSLFDGDGVKIEHAQPASAQYCRGSLPHPGRSLSPQSRAASTVVTTHLGDAAQSKGLLEARSAVHQAQIHPERTMHSGRCRFIGHPASLEPFSLAKI